MLPQWWRPPGGTVRHRPGEAQLRRAAASTRSNAAAKAAMWPQRRPRGAIVSVFVAVVSTRSGTVAA
jgi:hypothetical protein